MMKQRGSCAVLVGDAVQCGAVDRSLELAELCAVLDALIIVTAMLDLR